MAVGSLAGASGVARGQEDVSVVSEVDRRKIIGTCVTLYQLIPDEPRERYAGVWESSNGIVGTANSVIEEVPAIDTVADLEDFGEPIVGLLRNVTENVAEVYDLDINTKYLDTAVRATGYLPLIVQIWNLLQASLGVLNVADTKQRFIQKVKRTDSGKTAVKRFYIAVLLLLTEFVFLGSKVGYKAAFGATRRAANFGLVRLRGRVGLRAYSVLLSIVHWLVRGSFETTVSYIVEKTGNVAQDLSIEDTGFTTVSEEKITNVLPKETKGSLPSIDLGGYLPTDPAVESSKEFILDATTETLLIEQYGGSGIIEAEKTETTGSDWTFW